MIPIMTGRIYSMPFMTALRAALFSARQSAGYFPAAQDLLLTAGLPGSPSAAFPFSAHPVNRGY